MYVKIVQHLHVYETCRYLLILTAKNATANQLQCFSNKTNKQANRSINIKMEF